MNPSDELLLKGMTNNYEMEADRQTEFDESLDSLNFSHLKKKKKSVKFMEMSHHLSENLSKSDSVPSERTASPETVQDFTDFSSDINFDLTKKKRKKKINIQELDDIENSVSEFVEDTEFPLFPDTVVTNVGSDYPYDFLLNRVFGIMRAKNPNLEEGGRKKLIMKPPQILRIGTKKSSFANFLEICKLIHRLPQHVQSFLLVELGTSGSVDGNNQLIIKGRFQQKQIENVLRRYIKEYVTCHTCHSADTYLQRDTRLCFLQCEACGSRCSVSSIKSGFQAVTSKRAAMRAKNN